MANVSLAQAFEMAMGHHRAAQFAQAEAIYRSILSVQPNHPDALTLLGVLSNDLGRPHRAVELIERAIRENDAIREYHNNLGEAFRRLRRFDDAMAAFERALKLDPRYAEAHNNFGVALMESGRLLEAIAAYRRAIDLRPDFAEVYNNLGIALDMMGELKEAIECNRCMLQMDCALVQRHQVHSSLIMGLQYDPSSDAQSIYEETRK
jgi:tetratricopeptide (TPR) repeat protein